jgi:hypothetical protein
MADHLFAASYAKLNRARQFVQELTEYIEAYRKSCEATARFEFIDGEWESAFDMKDIDLGPSVIIGDAMHNLRAALDLMAGELVALNGENPKDVYFPFAKNLAELPARIKGRNFYKAGVDAVALLETLRPYTGGSLELRGLHDLDVQDKHIALIPSNSKVEAMTTLKLTDGAFDITQSSIELRQVRLTFPDGSVFAGDEIVGRLESLVELVNGILEAFVALVKARS